MVELRKEVINRGKGLSDWERFLLVMIEPNIEVARSLSNGDPLMEEYINEAIEVSNSEEFKKEYAKEVARRQAEAEKDLEDQEQNKPDDSQ